MNRVFKNPAEMTLPRNFNLAKQLQHRGMLDVTRPPDNTPQNPSASNLLTQ
jgi:hypothetical protein